MKKSSIANLIFTLVVLLAALGLWLYHDASHPAPPPSSGAQSSQSEPEPLTVTARLQYETADGTQLRDIPLDEDRRYDIESNGYTIHLEVKDRTIAFVDSPCPDHICENYGWLGREGDWAACLPARAALSIVSLEP